MITRLRSITFDSWLFGGMMTFVTAAVAAGLYVSYTSQRYVAEVIGGMPANVSIAFPFTIDAAVAAGLLGEWWLAARRKRERLAFAYMIGFGLVFAVLTVGGNALHGALALTVQRPVELHIGGQLVPLPWWIPIAVSGVPGLAIAGAGFAYSLVVSAWRHERVGGGVLSAAEAEALRQQLAEAAATASSLETQLDVARAAREQFEWTLTESEAELHRQLADVGRSGEEARAAAAIANAARERAEELLASQVKVASLLEHELAEARGDAEASRAAVARAEKLLARTAKPSTGSRPKGGRQAATNGGGSGPAREQGDRRQAAAPMAAVASNAGTATLDAHEPDDGAAIAVSAAPAADGSAAAHDAEPTAANDVREPASGATSGAQEAERGPARERNAQAPDDEPEPPDDRPRGGRRRARAGAREQARGRAHEPAKRVSGDLVRAMVVGAREQLLARGEEAGDGAIAEFMALERGHSISASRVRGYLAEAKHLGELDSAFPARRPRVIHLEASPVGASARAQEA